MALTGGILYILMHGMAKGGLFLCAGIVEQNTHTKDITQLGGLITTMPVTASAFLICTFWYVNALAAIGRRDEARTLFEKLLASRNRHGLLAEHIDTRSGELWGNFVQTYSMVGLINSAIRLSMRWDQAF